MKGIQFMKQAYSDNLYFTGKINHYENGTKAQKRRCVIAVTRPYLIFRTKKVRVGRQFLIYNIRSFYLILKFRLMPLIKICIKNEQI